jgi:hypothetical protein
MLKGFFLQKKIRKNKILEYFGNSHYLENGHQKIKRVSKLVAMQWKKGVPKWSQMKDGVQKCSQQINSATIFETPFFFHDHI